MNLLSLFSIVAFASEVVLSPVPESSLTTAISPTISPTASHAQSLFTIANTAFNSAELPTPTPSLLPTTPFPTPPAQGASRSTKKSSYIISLLGDSMIDTLGPDGGGLAQKLQSHYPSTTFTVINNGLGSTNIDSGIERLTDSYNYSGIVKSSVISEKPDMVIIESFAYNPYPYEEGAIDKHWLQLAHMIDLLRARLPDTQIVIAVTIAPSAKYFGDGAPFVNMSEYGKIQKTQTIKKYLESTIKFAQSQHVPLADAYHESLDSNGDGKIEYINAGDHIHYSPAGIQLMAKKISETIVTGQLLE